MGDHSINLIKELRAQTQASLADCKQALEETKGDIEEAAKRLRVRGAAISEKRGDRATGAGIVEAYVHGNAKIGVLVDLRAETDFVARSEDFRALAHDIALHVAAANPQYLKVEDIPDETRSEQERLIRQQFEGSGKPPQVIEKIVSGKIEVLAKEVCLMSQPFVKDPEKTVQDVINEAVAKFGEKIDVSRFIRFSL